MCNFFSCVITRDGRVLFCEDDHHETIISRANLKDDGIMDRFQRIEVLPPFTKAVVDERERASWLDESLLDKAVVLAQRVSKLKEEYKKIQQTAWEEYQKIVQPAWEEYLKGIFKIEGYVKA